MAEYTAMFHNVNGLAIWAIIVLMVGMQASTTCYCVGNLGTAEYSAQSGFDVKRYMRSSDAWSGALQGGVPS